MSLAPAGPRYHRRTCSYHSADCDKGLHWFAPRCILTPSRSIGSWKQKRHLLYIYIPVYMRRRFNIFEVFSDIRKWFYDIKLLRHQIQRAGRQRAWPQPLQVCDLLKFVFRDRMMSTTTTTTTTTTKTKTNNNTSGRKHEEYISTCIQLW